MSTTDRARGQVLVIFAGSLAVLILVAALAFDAGAMLLGRRDQQNAADAAALAGARFLPTDVARARAAAVAIATDNGFTEGVDSSDVTINIPPLAGPYRGLAGFIEVEIGSTRPSVFAGIMGVVGWSVGTRAVAANQNGVGAAFAMLALAPHECDALFVSGNGEVNANGNIQVNSDCTDGALRRQGVGVINVTAIGAACNVVGDIRENGPGDLNCVPNEGATEMPDPLLTLPAPSRPALASAAVQVSGDARDVPNSCPGSIAAPPLVAEPATCQFTSSYDGTTWRLFPGYYPGGIKLQGGTFYLEPGIYYLGGGGLIITGTGATAISVAQNNSLLDYGVMFYNTEAEGFHDACAAGTATNPATQCIGPIFLNGAEASIDLWPLNNGSVWDGIVIYQDRSLSIAGDDVTINGSTSTTQVRGTIYLPSGDVKVNGSGGTVTTDQIIAYTFTVNGSPGSTVNVMYDENFIFKLTAAGLVE